MMQSAPRSAGQPPPVKIYNAVYSSVQVYECMVRGIAVMRRRADSYVNATQILKVAGVDKGRRTKILEREVVPGKHEVVQGGYGKYQGTWIPLERGRDIALQYGVAPLLAPLFDFTPGTNSLPSLPAATSGGVVSPRPLSASSSYGSVGAPAPYVPPMPTALAPPPIMPGSALRLLNQGRAQGLFTPSNSILGPSRGGGHASPVLRQHSELLQPTSTGVSSPPPTSHQSLKRNRSEADADMAYNPTPNHYMSSFRTQSASKGILDPAADIQISDQSRPSSAGPMLNGEEGPSPSKRLRKDLSPPQQIMWQLPSLGQSQTPSAAHPFAREDAHMQSSAPQLSSNGVSKPFTFLSAPGKDNQGQELLDIDILATRFSTKPSPPSNLDPSAPSKDPRRGAILAAICNHDDSSSLFDLFRETVPMDGTVPIDVNIVLDDQGHTALHIAASMGRLQTVGALIASGADIHRGNFLGETPLIRACISTHNADLQIFHILLPFLHQSIRTLDTARKSVLHHVVALAGVRGRAHAASYYLDQIFLWIAEHEGGDFVSLVDLQDEHGDTALNIAARVGNRGLVRTLLDVGANRTLSNKLGLRPGDFGVETEELSGPSRAEDLLSSLRSGPPAPAQKSQDVIADMTAMIQGLNSDFAAEIKAKQDSLDVTQAHLRAATRELSEQRKQIQRWQASCAELDQVNQRAQNLDKALKNEDQFDWTGRTDLDKNNARDSAGPAFQRRGTGSTMTGIGSSMDISFNVDIEPPMPTTDSVAGLIRLKRLKMWHMRMEEMMDARLKSLQGASAEKEYQCKKIIALCTRLHPDQVEEMLSKLVVAVESESQIVDIGRVSGFMQKVHDGII